jgi:K(+)-stimulated pyrophosphate-energized sodium pump
MNNIIYFIPAAGVIALLFTAWKSSWVTKQEVGTDRMAGIAKSISNGAMAFLKAEYKVLSGFVVVVAAIAVITLRGLFRQFPCRDWQRFVVHGNSHCL